VSATSVLLTPLLSSTLTLTANGAPVSWSISEQSSALGSLNVAPAAGTVYPGSPVTVVLTESVGISLTTTLTVNPGEQVVTVTLGLGLRRG
jgi:hypothetical protein